MCTIQCLRSESFCVTSTSLLNEVVIPTLEQEQCHPDPQGGQPHQQQEAECLHVYQWPPLTLSIPHCGPNWLGLTRFGRAYRCSCSWSSKWPIGCQHCPSNQHTQSQSTTNTYVL